MPNAWKWSGIVLGPMITVSFRILEFYQAINLPWPIWTFEVAGFLVFCASVAGLLIGYQQENTALHLKVDEMMDGRKSKSLEVQNPVMQSIPGMTSKMEMGRELVSIRPKDLTDFYEGRTNSEGQRLASPYSDKWMMINGNVDDVMTQDAYACITLEKESNGVFMTQLEFQTKWNERLSRIRKGDKIQVIGRIGSIGPATLRLHMCELVDS